MGSDGLVAGVRLARGAARALGTVVATALLPWLCGCMPVLHVGAPTKLTLRPSGDPTKSMVVGMPNAAFSYCEDELEGIAWGTMPREHETYLTWIILAPSEPARDFERAVRVSCRVPEGTWLRAGQTMRLDCRVDLVTWKKYEAVEPAWAGGVFAGTVSATVRLSGQRLYVDLPETELRCVGGGTGALRVSGRVVAREESQNFDMDQRLFARWQARASGQAEPDSGEP